MSSRHTRRKLAKARAEEKLLGLAQAARSAMIAAKVRENKSKPIERNYYKPSIMGNLASYSHRAYVCHNASGSEPRKRTGNYRWK